jgi:Mce-associated membrane protein
VDTDDAAETGGEPGATGEAQPDQLTPAQLAALEAARAAKKARKAQRKAQAQAEKARLLAEEYARLAEEDGAGSTPVSLAKPAPPVSDRQADAIETAVVPEPTPAEPTPVEPDTEQAARSRVPLVTAAVALAACVAFAVAALIVFLTKDSGSSNSDANARDVVLQQARQDFVVLNTMDYRNVDVGLKRWADASTGTLHNQVVRATAVEKQHLTQAQDVASAVVVAAAVTSLDVADGSASVIASVDVTVKHLDNQAVVKRERLKGQMTRVGSAWRVSSLETVPVSSQ